MDRQNDSKLIWSALEHEGKEKTNDWYWTLGIVSILGVGISIYYGNYLFAIFIILAAIILVYLAIKPAEMMQYEITKEGVRINSYLYPFNHIKGFWIEQSFGISKLIIESERFFMPVLVIPLQNVDASDVKDFLEDKIPEKEIKEPLSHKITERIGF
jgi:hypothetical protein